uniref:Uncharacterized protein n=1 Tax=Leersia perrieri TaxID=77586 RepID=A0A0D9WSM6_9ORYZ
MESEEGRGRGRRRIVDYLNDGEELGVFEAAAARSLLPRFRWARAVRRIGRKGKGKEVEVEEGEIAVEKKGELAAAAALAVASTSACETESHTRTPDLGVGVSLLFLLAKTSDEFNKMVKVRAEMETLLREIKDEFRQSGGVGDESKSRCNVDSAASSCLTDTNENERGIAPHMEDQATSSNNNMEELGVCCEKSTDQYECFPRMDVLEEEFHTELELLQANYGSDVQLFLPEEHDAEPLDEITECREEDGYSDDSGEMGEEVVEDEDYDDDDESEYNGVNAVELERRLHELLHQRNQERIEELEMALKRAEKKLVEKEMEVSMWKDTAKLALRQDNMVIAKPACFMCAIQMFKAIWLPF